jgi:flagellar biosynthesis/type III secretory pathway chaperone
MNQPAGDAHPHILEHRQMLLHRQLLECLEQERRALTSADEAAILKLAAEKGTLLEQLQHLDQIRPGSAADAAPVPALVDLKRRIAAAHRGNQALISASLEVIQEFLACLHPPGPGTYGPLRGGGAAVTAALFQRQA